MTAPQGPEGLPLGWECRVDPETGIQSLHGPPGSLVSEGLPGEPSEAAMKAAFASIADTWMQPPDEEEHDFLHVAIAAAYAVDTGKGEGLTLSREEAENLLELIEGDLSAPKCPEEIGCWQCSAQAKLQAFLSVQGANDGRAKPRTLGFKLW